MTAAPLSIWRGDTLVTCPPRTTEIVGRVGRDALNFAVADALSRRPNVTREEIFSKAREHRVSHARQEVMWLLREARFADGARRYSLPAIAAAVGVEDHTTVLHGVRAHAKRIAAQ